jgi:cell division transport system permease protein
MLTSLKRVVSFAISDFSRNKGISLAAIFVLVVTIMLVSGLFFFQGIAGYLTSQLQDKIDITAYFKDGTAEQDILDVKDQIVKLSPNIKNVEYVSQDQALATFNETHQGNAVLARALQEVGSNPFLPSLNIVTNGEPAQYEQVANILQTSDFSKMIDKVDFSQKKATIENVYTIVKNMNLFGLVLGIVLIFLAISVVFNTIKLGVESSKEEISTMKIVGASDWFVRGPFIIQGIMYGVVAFIICILLSGIAAYFLSPKISIILPGFDLFSFFLTNWLIFVIIQLGFGVGVGAISALVVVKRHLEV